MQWSCPHCGVHLAVADGALGSGWSFSRCYKCGGFALIRRAEINIIKVDKAPPGERVLLPESSDQPLVGMLDQKAATKLNQHLEKKNTAPSSTSAPSSAPFPISSSVGTSGATSLSPPPSPDSLAETSSLATEAPMHVLPDPLPNIPHEKPRNKWLILGMSVCALCALVSGVYLFMQGQALFEKTQDYAEEKNQPTQAPQTQSQSKHSAPPSSIVIDQVQQTATAPIKSLLPEKLTPENERLIEDEAALQTGKTSPTLIVKPRFKKANLHSGPGLEYPVISSTQSENEYLVIDWSDRWFKVLPKSGSKTKLLGWIRNDMVRITTPDVDPLRQ